MATSNSILSHVIELMRRLRGVSARAMFGGHGIYKDGVMFAILADGELYFKVTGANRRAYDERGLAPFVYERRGKKVAMSYRAAPAECMDDPRIMAEWAEPAWRAAAISDALQS